MYIATSDDTMQETLLERLLEPLGRLPEVDIALCDHDLINEHGQPIARERRFFNEMLGEWVHIPSSTQWTNGVSLAHVQRYVVGHNEQPSVSPKIVRARRPLYDHVWFIW